MTDDDSKIILEVDLKNISDKSLIHIRNRVVWECKRRIAEGNDKLDSKGLR